MYRDLKREAVKKTVKKKNNKEEVVSDIKTARVYFGHVLQTTSVNGFMEEYLFRGLQKLMDIEDKVQGM